ncbi:glycogen/starch/alpha-glucan phosphorylase [Candidatus Venteria ishoeyi]|uniref:Alpha-1,4 glucan phosphorylase n=1 Tax=Candidatus Venteria ishoeyi TaxID=1899563 RepID=A0A1H6F9P5_9GAMM|nr:glycogen/starch/alpha-glucan phosphorylase [Candidatus Venteria ishoeyi]SEH06333.1 Maltodextrin phosphorylase [Candidatus Venteria ishoeyi]
MATRYGKYLDENPLRPARDFYRTKRMKSQLEQEGPVFNVDLFCRVFLNKLLHRQVKLPSQATPNDYYMALSHAIRDRLVNRWMKSTETYHEQDVRMVCYLSAEFLLGKQLNQNLLHAGCWNTVEEGLEKMQLGHSLYDLMAQEPDPGLGNGGLGRLAACFLDSLATLDIPAIGYGIRYEFGIFEQVIEDGWQVERPDYWLQLGNPWEIHRPEYMVEVKLGGHTEFYIDDEGWQRVKWKADRTVLGTPFDMLVPGYNTKTVATLRLWSARASQDFNFHLFNEGDYTRAVADKTYSENITKVLYPNDNTPQGQELRLTQQYFFVACSLQDMIRQHLIKNGDLSCFQEKVAIQLNDTHPSIGVAELMRLLVDEHKMNWDKAWTITCNSFSYTNHTLLPEALERWPVRLLSSLLPRHMEIIYEINRRFLNEVRAHYPNDPAKLARMSLIVEGDDKQVRMAHLACVGSHAVNGVAALHTELVKSDLMHDFHEFWPDKFSNKTNGVTPRRWMLISNPKLSHLISATIGKDWVTDLAQLQKLEAYADNPEFREKWWEIKQENKQDLAECIYHQFDLEVRPDAIFDVQVKRLHEYKRQLLKVLHIIAQYQQLKKNPDTDIQAQLFLFGAKAAPGYYIAKLIIKLINSVATVLDEDKDVRGRLKIVFLPNFNVSVGEQIYPAAELSEQISLAGKEASGTGNMKFALNGALTIGTLDGANIEIRDAVGKENMFCCGLDVKEVKALRTRGYHPREYYNDNPELREVINQIACGVFSPDKPKLFQPIVDTLLNHDEYLLLADYQSYADCHAKMLEAYQDRDNWIKMSILNTARMGFFSSDRSIAEYCRDIWHVDPVEVEVPDEQIDIPIEVYCPS